MVLIRLCSDEDIKGPDEVINCPYVVINSPE